MSLDGFIAGPNDSMDWAVAQWSDEGENTRDIDVRRSAVADEVLQAAGAILGGAGTTSPFASSMATTGSTVGSGRGRCLF
jgi:hypothetical protein